MYTVVRATRNHRVDKLRSLLQKHDMEALLVSSDANRRYLSGFRGSAGMLLITKDEAIIFTDFRYRLQVAEESPSFTLYEISPTVPIKKKLLEVAKQMGLYNIGFEAAHVSYHFHQQLQKGLQEEDGTPIVTLQATIGMVESLRAMKDDDEIATLRRAIAITDAAIGAVLEVVTPEHTERQVAWMLEVAMREWGADSVAFPVIVAAGSNAALPHARPSDAPLGEGQPIIIDMGAVYNGYHADMTRTVIFGKPDDRFWEVYNTVLEAQEHAIKTIRPGMKESEADKVAREYIDSAGFGKEFGHSLGHGVGLEVHEGPHISKIREDELVRGSVFSVEPGIYIEGWGGVRIEDLVLLHQDRCEVLSQFHKQPVLVL